MHCLLCTTCKAEVAADLRSAPVSVGHMASSSVLTISASCGVLSCLLMKYQAALQFAHRTQLSYSQIHSVIIYQCLFLVQQLRLDNQETVMCIFQKTRCCIDEFTTSQGLRSSSKSVASKSLDIDGEFGRFEIWAENIGALQAQDKPTSLDYRLRNSAGVTRQVEAILDDIVESLQECKYLSGQRIPNWYVIDKLFFFFFL